MNNDNEYWSNSYDMLKCIWMASSVVEYKLCDKQFDCENCQFDKVMRNFADELENKSGTSQNILSLILSKLNSIKFDDKFIYLKNNLIIKQILPNTYYLGVNPIFISFLDNVGIIMECCPGKNISKGQPIVQFFGEWGAVTLTSPMNFSIYDKVNNPADDLIKSKWIAMIGAIPQEITAGQMNQNEWESLHQKSIKTVEDIKSDYQTAGPTMHDGGSQLKYLHQIVGKDKYIELLNSLNN